MHARATLKAKIRNLKSEAECVATLGSAPPAGLGLILTSDFGLRISFGSRISDFGFQGRWLASASLKLAPGRPCRYTRPLNLYFTHLNQATMIRKNERPNMGLMDYLKTQFLEIIEWQDDSRDTLSFRYPDMDKEIKSGAQLIVRESQAAQFVYLGQFGDTFGPGKHTLTTDNIPILSTLKGWKYGLHSPFKADVYFVNTRLFTGNKWGTANPIMMRDPDFGIVRVARLRHFRFPCRRREAVPQGSRRHRRPFPARRICRHHALAHRQRVQRSAGLGQGAGARRGGALRRNWAQALLPLINPAVTSKYGIEISSFVVENVSVPPEVEQAIDKRAAWRRWAISTTT